MNRSSQTMKDNDNFLKQKMKDMLAQCLPEQQRIFGLMYNPKGNHAHPVEGVKREQVDWAFAQIERTLEENTQKGSKDDTKTS